ncbi:MAG: SH3 domain-containing protein [Bacteroidetes bacterium]|nr:SH3 domain-containing protein [Bacteroidota bacterium]
MRNRSLLSFNGLAIVVLIFFFSSLAFATADGPDFFDVQGVAPNNELKVHLKPTDSSGIAGKIPHKATCLKNLGCTGDSNWWCKISFQGTVGWANGRFLKEGGNCSSSFSQTAPEISSFSAPVVFTEQLLDGKTLYKQDTDVYVKLLFLRPNAKSLDRTIVFTFLKTKDCLPGTTESLAYRLKNGKITYYPYDGSKTRLSLLAITSTSWMVLEEEDIDGDDQQFDFGKAVTKSYEFKNRWEGTQLDYSPN